MFEKASLSFFTLFPKEKGGGCMKKKVEFKMKAIQPYFVIAAPKYHKNIIMNYGIAHFYRYHQHLDDMPGVIAVPDGCVDIMFEKDSSGIKARVAGTVLERTILENKNEKEYFGVRFMPGVLPAVLNTKMEELVQKECDLNGMLKDSVLPNKIEEASESDEWIEVFMQAYKSALAKQECICKKGNALEIAQYVRDEIIQTNGLVKMAELAAKTGYTERYVNKVFHEVVGVNPKTFGKIIKFQKAIQLINQDSNMKLIDISVDTGYYDQPHFIREFKKFAEFSPKEYQKLILKYDYYHRINEKEWL